jgi:predicted histone-like DNA-binding protein
MAQLTLKVRKVKGINPKTKQEGLVARVVTNGKQSFEDICELAGLNTTMNVAELEAAGKLILQAAARELKNGKIVDLGPIGAIYPAVSGKWAEKAEDLQKSDLTLRVNYRPSDEIDAAIKGAKLAWASAEDEKKEQENGGENTTTDPDEGGNTGGGSDDDNLEG